MCLCVFFLSNINVQEIYSIKLPGDPKLGEGKPENQNHAIIFTRGEAVQTIDMNQVTSLSSGVCLCLSAFLLGLLSSFFFSNSHWLPIWLFNLMDCYFICKY